MKYIIFLLTFSLIVSCSNESIEVITVYDYEEGDFQYEDTKVYIDKAVTLYKVRKYEDARPYIYKALEIESENPIIYNLLASLEWRGDNKLKSNEIYESSMTRFPNFLPLYNNYGRCMCQDDKINKGIKVLELGMSKINPEKYRNDEFLMNYDSLNIVYRREIINYESLVYNYAVCLEKAGKCKKAASILRNFYTHSLDRKFGSEFIIYAHELERKNC